MRLQNRVLRVLRVAESYQYCKQEAEDGCRAMLLCRATMGAPFMTGTTHQQQRTPPENPRTPGLPHDSIFAESGVARSGAQVHNEYVVFAAEACYPE